MSRAGNVLSRKKLLNIGLKKLNKRLGYYWWWNCAKNWIRNGSLLQMFSYSGHQMTASLEVLIVQNFPALP
jgi:hypothetical protein